MNHQHQLLLGIKLVIAGLMLAIITTFLAGINYGYHFDRSIGVLIPNCTVEQYENNRMSCIKDIYKPKP